jgi:hypothetical protein
MPQQYANVQQDCGARTIAAKGAADGTWRSSAFARLSPRLETNPASQPNVSTTYSNRLMDVLGISQGFKATILTPVSLTSGI